MRTLKQKSLNLLMLFIISSFISVTAQTVYVTKTGEKYHTESCRYLKYSKIAIDLAKAQQQDYTPCKVCKPATVVKKKTSTASTVTTTETTTTKTTTTTKRQVAVRCSATTQKGTRCKRTTTNSNGRCWQHQ